ncbi:MAG: hypothetical protein U1E22_02585 [Coriobacteriia bacterium]|nr:hypothetical protein [Coriobacteriia bacterium]
MSNYVPSYDDWDSLYALVRDLFCAAAATCLLWAVHRIARGVLLGGRVEALDEFGDAFTPEEREVLIHRIKHDASKF